MAGTSLVDGQIELMLHRFLLLFIAFDFYLLLIIILFCSIVVHFLCIIRIIYIVKISKVVLPFFYRRLLHDDSRGVGEVLNETVCVLEKCEGLTVSIKYLC